ncbi:hypothetical protein MMC17_001857 [Xylographa soralifera]|nr:hypothetical protein [Xylographa soralifera]
MKHFHGLSERFHRKKDMKEHSPARTSSKTTMPGNNTETSLASHVHVSQSCGSAQIATTLLFSESTSSGHVQSAAPTQFGLSAGSVSTGSKPTSTRLCQEAMDRVKRTEDWQTFSDLLNNQQKSPQSASQPLSSSAASCPSDVLNIVEAVSAEIQQQQVSFQLGSRTVVVQKVCGQVRGALITIKDVGGTIASTNPFASLAWSSLQFVLQLAATAKEVRDMCWEVVPRVVYLISRYQTLEELYIDDDRIQKSKTMLGEAVTELYTLILSYQVSMVTYLSSRWKRIKTSVGKASDSQLQTIWMQIKSKEESLPGLQTLADREIGNETFRQLLASSAQLRDTLGQTWAEVQGIAHVVNEQQRKNVLEWISDVKYETAHTEDRRTALANTGQWLLQHEDYGAWRSELGSSCFWLSGFMGSGKSCLSHAVIEDMTKDTDPPSGRQLAYYYIDGNEALRDPKYATRILRCLLKQLADLGPGGGLMKQIIEQYEIRASKSDLNLVKTMELLQCIIERNRSTVLILDGLDECDKGNQNQLIKNILFLYRNCEQTGSSLKVFFASRPIPVIERALSQFKPRRIKTADYNSGDIDTLIQTRIREAFEDPSYQSLYKSGDSDQTGEVERILRDKSQGMFRWVQSALEYLHASVDFEELQERLERLHHLQDLFSLYDEIYEAMTKRREPRTLNGLRVVLTHLMYAEKPVIFHWDFCILNDVADNECLSAYGLSPKALFLHIAVAHARGTVVSSFSTEYIVSLCPSFIEAVQNVDSTYRYQFPHFSVQEYLLDRYENLYSSTAAHSFLVKEYMRVFTDEIAYNRIGKLGRRYFLVCVAHCLIEQLDLFRSSVDSWDEAMYVQDFADQVNMFLLTPVPSAGFLRWDTCVRSLNDTKPMPELCRALLTDPPSTVFVRIFLDLGWKDPKLSFESLDVMGMIYRERPYAWTAIHFAASRRNSDAIKWLALKNIDLNRVALDGETAFYALTGHKPFRPDAIEADVCRKLLECGARPRVPDGSGPYALYRPGKYHADENTFMVSDLQVAIREACPTKIAALLLENGAEEVESMDEWYMMALWECYKRVEDRDHLRIRVFEYDCTLRDYLLDKAGDYISIKSKLGNVFSPPSRYISKVCWNSAKPYSRRVFLEELAQRIGRDYGEITRYELLDKPPVYESIGPVISQCSVEDVDENDAGEDNQDQAENVGLVTDGKREASPAASILKHQTW